MSEQKKAEEFGITEDDVSEIRQDINKFRFELVEILRKNRFDIGTAGRLDGYCGGRRAKQMERRILKGFNVDIHDLVKDAFAKQDNTKTVDIFKVMAEAINKNSKSNQINQQLNHIQFSNEESMAAYSPATITAAKKFKRSLSAKPTEQTNGRRATVTQENGPMGLAQQASIKASPRSRGRGVLSSDTSPPPSTTGTRDALNAQMLSAAVIPCTITLNVPAERKEEGEEVKEANGVREVGSEEEQRRLLERTAVMSLGGHGDSESPASPGGPGGPGGPASPGGPGGPGGPGSPGVPGGLDGPTGPDGACGTCCPCG